MTEQRIFLKIILIVRMVTTTNYNKERNFYKQKCSYYHVIVFGKNNKLNKINSQQIKLFSMNKTPDQIKATSHSLAFLAYDK